MINEPLRFCSIVGKYSFICYYQSNHSKVEAILLSALPKDTTSKLSGLSTLSLFYAERQAGKL